LYLQTTCTNIDVGTLPPHIHTHTHHINNMHMPFTVISIEVN